MASNLVLFSVKIPFSFSKSSLSLASFAYRKKKHKYLINKRIEQFLKYTSNYNNYVGMIVTDFSTKLIIIMAIVDEQRKTLHKYYW